MAPIKRYTLKELRDTCYNLFIKSMSISNYLDLNDYEYKKGCTTLAQELHEEYKNTVEECEEKIEMYYDLIEYSGQKDKETIKLLERDMNFLKEEHKIISNMNMQTQRKRNKETNSLEYARTTVRFPLNKLINSYYDDLFLEVLFYDDVTTLAGKFKEYKELDEYDKIDFVKKNIEVTHMGLVVPKSDGTFMAIIGLFGEVNNKNNSVIGVTVLPSLFADFSRLMLRDTMSINNNDLKQFFQNRIDLDKEDMELLATQVIRGDEYKIYRSTTIGILKETKYFVRYICPSTGRIYYNELNLRNLKISEYFKDDDYNSYLEAWWSITHLGARVEGKPVISC